MKPENLFLWAIVGVGVWFIYREMEKQKIVEAVEVKPALPTRAEILG